jgi:hypothetical protein
MGSLCVNSRWVAIPLVATRLSSVPARLNAAITLARSSVKRASLSEQVNTDKQSLLFLSVAAIRIVATKMRV